MNRRYTHRYARFYVALLAAVLLIHAHAYAASKRTLFKVATYNVKNMTDVFDDPYSRDEDLKVKPRQEIQAIADTLRHINADVVALQEVESEHVLQAMVNEMLPDMGYGYVAVEPTNARHAQHLGILSRRPILSVTSHRYLNLTLPEKKRTWRFARDVLKVQLQATPTRQLTLYVVHFKSRRDSSDDAKSTNWRLAEAAATRRIISEQITQDPNALILLVGDVNAPLNTPAINLLLKIRPDGLPMLFDTHAGLPEQARITYLKKPYRSTIDYILASKTMHMRLVKDTPTVIHDPDLLQGSDHAPLSAIFDLSD